MHCGKCAELGDNYCKLNPSPAACMAMRSSRYRLDAINISCIFRGLLKRRRISAACHICAGLAAAYHTKHKLQKSIKTHPHVTSNLYDL